MTPPPTAATRSAPDVALGRVPPPAVRELRIYVAVGTVIAVLGAWLFSALTDEVLDNAWLVRFDVLADAWIHAHITIFGTSAMVAITFLGSTAVLASVATAVALLLLHRKRYAATIIYLGAYLGGLAIEQTIKHVVHRSRPPYGAQFLRGASFSFPSGHSMGAMTVYGTAIFLLLHRSHFALWQKRMGYALVALLILLIGISRVYLGVHYPSDVLGGFAAGAAWASFCVAGIAFVRWRGRRE